MSYTKPGVEVTQLQSSVSANLIPPDLLSVMVGPGYHVAEITDNPDSTFMDSYYQTYDKDSGNTITVSGLTSDWPTIDQNSVYVDLIGGTTANAGVVAHLVKGSDFDTTVSGVVLYTAASGLNITDAFDGAEIKIGYRARKTNLNKFLSIESPDEVQSRVGLITTINPLAQALSVALTAANKTVYGYGTVASDDSTHASALSYLSAKEVYALIPLSHTSAVLTNYKDHVNFYSRPEQKKHRITIQNKKLAWTDADGVTEGDYATGYASALTNGSIGSTAQQLKANALAYGERRVFWTLPDVVYIRERRHISTLKQAYLDACNHIDSAGLALGLNAILATTITMADGTKYYAGEELTDTLWAIIKEEYTYLTCLIPVPGYYLAAIVGGQISAYDPSQPFTNISIPSISLIKYSNDVFSETQLNTIAEGGNYIFVQSTDSSPIICRHQLSTDMSSVERRELSITKTLDFCSKFLTNTLSPYIGKYNITPRTMKILAMTFSALSTYLVREGHVNECKLEKLEQDEIQKDSIIVTVRVGVMYPINYIRITLIF